MTDFAEFVDETHRLEGRLSDERDTMVRAEGLSLTWTSILDLLEHQDYSVAQLARRLGLTRQSVQKAVDRLSEERLLEYRTNPDHRRAKLAVLTQRGRSRLQLAIDRQETWMERIAHGLNVGRLRSTIDFIREVRNRVESSSSNGQHSDD